MQIARVRESECVGCTKCLAVCPVDAIVGTNQMLHVVLTDECIGCKLCLPPCPVDCIEMVDTPILAGSPEKIALAMQAKSRYQRRMRRLSKQETPLLFDDQAKPQRRSQIKAEIQNAFSRVTKKRYEQKTSE